MIYMRSYCSFQIIIILQNLLLSYLIPNWIVIFMYIRQVEYIHIFTDDKLLYLAFPFLFHRKKVADALMNTLFSLNKFEQGVKDCLEVWLFCIYAKFDIFRCMSCLRILHIVSPFRTRNCNIFFSELIIFVCTLALLSSSCS